MEKLRLNIQFFAEELPPKEEPPTKTEPLEKVELTQSELNKKIEAEADRKLASALEKKQKEWDSQLEQKIADAKKDAESYAKMTAKEKEDAEHTKRLKAIEERERELNNRELLGQIEADLRKDELPTVFAKSLLNIQDNEQIKKSIGEIKQAFDDAVNEAVKGKLRQDTPKAGGSKIDSLKSTSKAEMARNARIIK